MGIFRRSAPALPILLDRTRSCGGRTMEDGWRTFDDVAGCTQMYPTTSGPLLMLRTGTIIPFSRMGCVVSVAEC